MKTIGLVRLTQDPDVRYSADGKAVARFSVAAARRFKREGQPDADFFNAVAFGKNAEFVEKYLKKGTKVLITGVPENNNFTNKEGQKVYRDQIRIEEIEFAESKNAGGSTAASAPAPAAAPAPAPTAASASDDFISFDDLEDGGLPWAD